MILRFNINMENPHLILQRYLRENGFKSTSQREAILTFLLKAGKHLGPEEIYTDLRRKDPRLGRATVFRTLKILERCGLASRVTLADGRHKFESKHGREHHDHMICIDCGATIEFSNPSVERIQDQVARRHGFRVLWHRHELFGRCRSCETGAARTA